MDLSVSLCVLGETLESVPILLPSLSVLSCCATCRSAGCQCLLLRHPEEALSGSQQWLCSEDMLFWVVMTTLSNQWWWLIVTIITTTTQQRKWSLPRWASSQWGLSQLLLLELLEGMRKGKEKPEHHPPVHSILYTFGIDSTICWSAPHNGKA